MENRGCCGLNCGLCEAQLATANHDEELRARVAEQWSAAYGFQFRPDQIHCTGCMQPGVKVGHCSMCEVRRCATEKRLPHCGLCEDYPCELGSHIWNNVSESVEYLKGERGR